MNNFNDPFKEFNRGFKKSALSMMILTTIGNLIFWSGLIFVSFWCLKHFGVI